MTDVDKAIQEQKACERKRRITRKIVRGFVWAVLTALIVWQGFIISEEQDQRRASNERLFRIFHGAAISVIMCDEEGVIVEYNRASQEIFGWTREELMGQHVSVLIAPHERAVHDKSFKDAVAKLRSVDEDWRVTRTGMKGTAVSKNGDEFEVNFSTRGISYSGKIEFLAFARKDELPKFEAGPLKFPKKD